MMKMAIRMTLFLLLALSFSAKAQTAPTLYYTFDAANPLNPTIGTGALSIVGTYTTPAGGQVGKHLSATYAGTGIIKGGVVSATDAVTIQLLLKHNYRFDFSRDPQIIRWGNLIASWIYPEMWFITSTNKTGGGALNDNQKIYMNGINAKSWGYHKDDQWHMYTYVFNAKTGEKKIYIDGLLASGFTVTGLATGTINGVLNSLEMNTGGLSYTKTDAGFDEVAFYPVELTAAQIYKNWQDVQSGQHYTTALAGSVPSALPVTSGMEVNEFAPGYVQGSGSALAIQRTALRQLLEVPLPRYRAGHVELRHMNWMQANYFGGYKQYTDAQTRDTSTEMIKEMAYNWNYMLLISDHVSSNRTQYANPAHWASKWVQLANANPTIPAAAITFWAQFKPSFCNVPSDTQYVARKGFSAQHYVRNNIGQFVSENGITVVTQGKLKVLSPIAPLDSIRRDGEAMNCFINNLQSYLTRPINYISENNEFLPIWSSLGYPGDPAINASKVASGLTWDEFLTTRKSVISNAYSSQFVPNLQATAAAAGQDFVYSEYAVYGFDANDLTNDTLRWRGERNINGFVKGRKLQTVDYYPRKPDSWYYGSGAYKGWGPMVESVRGTIANQDSFMAPFTIAGWSINPETNMRSSQFLGNLKLMCALGALRFQPAYFNLDPANVSSPKGYAYQAMNPSYAQAIFSRVPFWENSILLTGDYVYNQAKAGIWPGFQYYAGNKHKVVTVRQSRANSNEYVITGALQKLSNMVGENVNLSDQTATITLAGSTVTFPIREQGSVYIWNKTDSNFIALDGWHERGDPNRWTGDFYVQSELYDAGTFPVKTYGKTAYDYTNAYSVISYADTATVFDTLKYTFQPRNDNNYYVWVRARSKDGSSGNVIIRLDGNTQDTTKAITSTDWFYYRFKLSSSDTIKYSISGDIDHIIKLRVNNKKLELDQIVLTTDKNLTFPEATVICGVVANVTASGATTFCLGSSVVLSANASSSYVWSTGATTQTIKVISAGSYSVTVYDVNGCSGSSSATTVTVNSLPGIPVITVTGNDCYGDSLLLSSAISTTYTWSTGATTRTIYVKTDALYNVVITNAAGCTNSNAYTSDFSPPVIVNTSSMTALTGCLGDTVKLRINNAFTYASYFWASFPDTASTISTDSILTYVITSNDTVRAYATDLSGCDGSSIRYVIKEDQCDTCNSVTKLRASRVTKSSAMIAWGSITVAERFIVYLFDRSTNTTVTSTVNGSRVSTVFTGLKPNNPYSYYVVSYCAEGLTYTSFTKRFTTLRY